MKNLINLSLLPCVKKFGTGLPSLPLDLSSKLDSICSAGVRDCCLEEGLLRLGNDGLLGVVVCGEGLAGWAAIKIKHSQIFLKIKKMSGK